MERLTKRERQFSGCDDVLCAHRDGMDCYLNCGYCSDDCPWYMAALKRLAEYEDTGLTPGEVRDIAEKVSTIVTCGDCKHSHMTYDGECKYCDYLQEDGGEALYLPKGFFCAAGERAINGS